MRFFAVLTLLALAACGQPAQQTPSTPSETTAPASAPEVIPAEWVGTLTASPRVVRSYNVATFALEGTAGSIQQDPSGARLTTASQLGAYGPVLDLGPDVVSTTARVLRVKVKVERGALQFVMERRDHPANYRPRTKDVAAGNETTIYLPVDPHAGSILVVANGRAGENVGVVSSVELLSAP